MKHSFKTNLIIKRTERQKSYLYQAGETEDDVCVALVVSGTTIGSCSSRQQILAIKRLRLHPLQPLGHPPSFCRRDSEMKVLLLSVVLGLFMQATVKLSFFSNRYRGGASWEEALGYMCVCPFWGLVMDP